MSSTAPLLTTANVVEYVRGSLRGKPGMPLDVDVPLVATEIGDGNLNFAFCVMEQGNEAHAVFVKQAPGFIKCLGEDFKLSAERLLVEGEVMEEYTAAVPSHCPTLIMRDASRYAMITEYLGGYELMRTALRGGRCKPNHAQDIARFMARTHARTHATTSSAPAWARLTNEQMCGITADYVFSKPLDAADPTNRCSEGLGPDAAVLRADAELRNGVEQLRLAFLSRKECLVHGDIHTGSVMVPISDSADGAAKVIDAEFAHFGAASFDVGTFIANLMFAGLATSASIPVDASATTARSQVDAMMHACWETYSAAMREHVWSKASAPIEAEAEMLSLTAGFAGCELIRRVIGAAHVDDFEQLANPPMKLRAERAALAIGASLVKSRQDICGNFSVLLSKVTAAEASVACD
jgi:5-methylthioribose kinase